MGGPRRTTTRKLSSGRSGGPARTRSGSLPGSDRSVEFRSDGHAKDHAQFVAFQSSRAMPSRVRTCFSFGCMFQHVQTRGFALVMELSLVLFAAAVKGRMCSTGLQLPIIPSDSQTVIAIVTRVNAEQT